MSNKEKIRKHLARKGSITPLEALFVYRVGRLAPRIQELREEGIEIDTVRVVDGAGTAYTRYELN